MFFLNWISQAVQLFILAVLIIVASIIADYRVGFDEQPVTFLSIAVVISVLFYYLWLHLQFVREHEQALVADQRMQIMLSQIQPHFLYNTLAVIQNLCRSDPAQAEAVTVIFSKYLRGNMDSLLSESIIPFQKELKHTQEYLEDELFANVDRMNDLPQDALKGLEESFTEMNDVEISYKETAYGTKLLVAKEVSDDTDFVDILSVYKGYSIEFVMTPNPSTKNQTLTDAQIQMCVDFLSELDFVEAK